MVDKKIFDLKIESYGISLFPFIISLILWRFMGSLFSIFQRPTPGKKSKRQIWLICGPSSCGKSTFITSKACKEIVDLPKGTKIITPGGFNWRTNKDVIIHYNLLREFLKPNPEYLFSGDDKWNKIVSSKRDVKAIVIKTSKESIIQRIGQRSFDEEKVIIKKYRKPYDKEMWHRIYKEIDLQKLYDKWEEELISNNIPYIVVDGETKEFNIVKQSS